MSRKFPSPQIASEEGSLKKSQVQIRTVTIQPSEEEVAPETQRIFRINKQSLESEILNLPHTQTLEL